MVGMKRVNRRGFLGTSVLAASVSTLESQERTEAPAPPGNVTRTLARWVVDSQFTDIPLAVR